MLGVRRTTVTVVANVLQQAGLIRYHRGRIEIVDQIGSRRGRANATTPFAARSARSRRSRADSGKHRRPPALKARRPSSLLPISASVGTRIVPCRDGLAARRRFAIGPLRLPAGPLATGAPASPAVGRRQEWPQNRTTKLASSPTIARPDQLSDRRDPRGRHRAHRDGGEIAASGQGHYRGSLCRFARRDLAGQLQYPGISAGRPLQPRAQARPQAPSPPPPDQQADRRGRARA